MTVRKGIRCGLQTLQGIASVLLKLIRLFWDMVSGLIARIAFNLVSQVTQLIFGSAGRIRTYDRSVNSRLLYH